jgi:hypothetical protein
MKKSFPYVIGAVVLVVLIFIMASTATKPPRKMDERLTLRQSDKIPYGTRVARELLGALFPSAALPFDRNYPSSWDSIDMNDHNQAVILMADYFDADRDELEEMAEFVEKGNYIFIISRAASNDVASFFKVAYSNDFYTSYSTRDSLRVALLSPAFAGNVSFTYPGKKYDGSFRKIDSTQTVVLGNNGRGQANFIQLNKGKGTFYLHTAPLAFSNYFILHKNNAAYYEQVLSVLPKNVDIILWNEYYLEKPRNPRNEDPSWLKGLFSNPAFKWGFLVGAFTLALFVLLGMRRRQRMIPRYEKPKNDSMDFVKTLGRLYYDRKDHKNLAMKMAAYFLEHVRSKYKLPTHTLDEMFVQALHFKSGYPEQETRTLILTINTTQSTQAITEIQLTEFHKQLEMFYQNT